MTEPIDEEPSGTTQRLITFYTQEGTKFDGVLDDAPDDYHVLRASGDGRLSDSFEAIREDIRSDLRSLDYRLTERLLGDTDASPLVDSFPISILFGGIDSDIPLSRDLFSRCAELFDFEEARRIIYLQDLIYLTESFGTTFERAGKSLKEMFRLLAEIDADCLLGGNGVQRIRTQESFAMVKEAESFVIRLRSSLDILSRLLREIEHLPDQFNSFRKVSMDNASLYSAYKRASMHSGEEGHIFTDFPEALYLTELRNEVIHNRPLETLFDCFVRIEGDRIRERFFLLPDSDQEGRLTRWKGRCRFYSQEKRGAECLPTIYREISLRIHRSLDLAIGDLEESTAELRASGQLISLDADRHKEIRNRALSASKQMIKLIASEITDNKAAPPCSMCPVS